MLRSTEALAEQEACEGWHLVESGALLRLPDYPVGNQLPMSAIAALPAGSAISARIHVGSGGDVAAALHQYGFGVDADGYQPALSLILPVLAPGALLHPGTPAMPIPDQTDLRPCRQRFDTQAGRPAPGSLAIDRHLSLPLPAFQWPWNIASAISVLAAGGGGVLTLTARHIERDARIRREIASLQQELVAASYSCPDDRTIQAGLANCRAMLNHQALVELAVSLDGKGQDSALCNLLAIALFGTVNGESQDDCAATGLRMMAGSAALPPVLVPHRHALALAGKAVSRGLEADRDWTVGTAAGGIEVGLSPTDRARHLYVIGATGTGKSTLLKSLIAQDVARGEGIVLIDPHGDLAEEVAELVPASRKDDLVFADAADPEGLLAVELLPDPSDAHAFELAADMLITICKNDLYSSSKDAFGPLFENYFRRALALLMSAEPQDRILANFPRIFEDARFRRDLLGNCQDADVLSFWRNTATRTTGEIELTNVTPYITSKLTKFISSPQARAIFPAPGNGLDFRSIMDQGQILILRCPKGVIGEGLAELAVSACLMKLRNAAMARTGRTDRRPVRVYIDEFQNCRGNSLQTLLAEGRKFGVSLVLANQSLGQIGGTSNHSLGAATLANVGSLVAFRLGAADAIQLAPWLDSPDRWRELCQLPDFVMNARLLMQGKPGNYYGLHGRMTHHQDMAA